MVRQDDLPAFTLEQAARLSGLSARQALYWARTHVFEPQYTDNNTRSPYSRIYSFRDVVGLRTLAKLRKQVSLQALRAISAWFKERYESPWASLRFYVIGREVIFDEPDTGLHVAPLRGQYLLPVELEPIARETQAAVVQLRQRAPDDIGQVARHRYVLQNDWVVKGTRVPTRGIWNFHDAGYDTAAIIREYPTLKPADVQAAIRHEQLLREQLAS